VTGSSFVSPITTLSRRLFTSYRKQSACELTRGQGGANPRATVDKPPLPGHVIFGPHLGLVQCQIDGFLQLFTINNVAE